MRLRGKKRMRELPSWRKDPLGEAQRLRGCLVEGDARERLEAIAGIQRMLHNDAIDGEKAKSILVRALSDFELPVRYRAIKAMVADRRTVSGVLIALRIGGKDVKRMGIRLLNKELDRDPGLWKSDNITDEEINEACTVLARALIDKDDVVGHEACEALCRLAERSPVQVMERLSAFRRGEGAGLSDGAVLGARLANVDQAVKRAMELNRAKG